MPPRDIKSPYVGLVPYTEQQWDLFVGREGETQVIIDNLRGARFTLLYGPTGVGKTSVLRAGVVHRLRELARENLAETGSPEFVVAYFKSWRDDPVAGLAERIRASAALAMRKPDEGAEPEADVGIEAGADAEADVGADAEAEAESPSPPRPLALTIKACCDKTQSDLLVILDQFEEYFLYHGHERGPGTFSHEFPRAVNRTDLRVNFLVSIREDMLSKLDSFKGSIPNLFGNYLRVEHLSRIDAERAIREPLIRYNAIKAAEQSPGDGRPRPLKYEVEDELVKAVCDQLRPANIESGPAGGGWVVRAGGRQSPASDERIQAHFLQLVMNTLWEREAVQNKSHLLRRKTLGDLGGARSIIKSHLNGEMNRLTPEQQDVAAKIFFHLVTPTGEKIAHTVRDLSAYTNLPPDQVEPVLQRLAHGGVRLIRHRTAESGRSQVTRYEINHDVQVPAVLDWRERYIQKLQQREQEQARRDEVIAKHRAELEVLKHRQRARRRLYLLILTTGLAVLSLGLTFYARLQSKAAGEANRLLREERSRLAAVARVVDMQDRAMPYFKAVMRGHARAVNAAAFSPDGARLLTGSDDGTARVWDVVDGRLLFEVKHAPAVRHVAFTPDGTAFVTGGDDGRARVWEAGSGQLRRVIGSHEGPLTAFALSRERELLATAGADRKAFVWSLATGDPVGTLEGHTGAINDVDFNRDGSRVVTASDDFTARVWDSRGGPSLLTLGDPKVAPKNAVNSARFSPDGSLVVSASADWNVYLWDAASGQLLAPMTGHANAVNAAEFSSDGLLIASAGDDKTVRIWDVKTRRQLRELTGHTDEVVSVVFNPSGLWLVSASADATARIWGVVDGRLLFELRGHTGGVKGAAFSLDSNSAATASDDTTARVWGLTGAGGLRVSEVRLRVVPEKYSGQCPAAIRLIGNISVVGVSGTVRYRFARTDKDEPGVERALTFDSPGTKEVSVVYRFGGRAYPNVNGSFRLEVLAPHEAHTDAADFEVRCSIPPQASGAETEATPAPVAP